LSNGGPSHAANQSQQEMGSASPGVPPLPRVGEGGRVRGETTIDGLRIVFREEGPTHTPPVVVLHGWGASIGAVASIQSFLSMSHRTVAIDLPGFGASDPPPVPWSSREYAELLRAFLAQHGIGRASFVGHSFGGKLSIVLAATWPEMVEKLVLVDSAGIPPKRGASYYAQVYAYKAGRRLLATTRLNGTIAAPLQRRFDSRFGSDDYRQAGSMRGTLVRVVNEDLRPLLPRIAAPTLLIWGERDDSTPLSDGRLMERLIPDAGLVVFPGAGHYAYADDFDRFSRVVGHFLAARQGSG
jgi:pimeloyl-ACP methyl ester carboxylesterase